MPIREVSAVYVPPLLAGRSASLYLPFFDFETDHKPPPDGVGFETLQGVTAASPNGGSGERQNSHKRKRVQEEGSGVLEKFNEKEQSREIKIVPCSAPTKRRYHPLSGRQCFSGIETEEVFRADKPRLPFLTNTRPIQCEEGYKDLPKVKFAKMRLDRVNMEVRHRRKSCDVVAQAEDVFRHAYVGRAPADEAKSKTSERGELKNQS